jgi:xanthine dehydrogenase accessory factor
MFLYQEALRLVEAGQPPVMATVVRVSGSTPQKPGARLLVRRDGTLAGTLGGGCVEADAWAEALALMEHGGGARLREFHLNEDLEEDGLVCGGTMQVLLEPLTQAELLREVVEAHQGGNPVALARLVDADEARYLLVRPDGSTSGELGGGEAGALARHSAVGLLSGGEDTVTYLPVEGRHLLVESFTAPPALLICGGGHVGYALARLAVPLGLRVLVVDDRAEFASKERFTDADRVVTAPFPEGVAYFTLTAHDAVVVATRGHKHDHVALLAATRSKAGYLALVGSRRKAALVSRALREDGVSPERVARVRCPAGLSIGARTPEEIAVSILAEVLMWRRGGDGQALSAQLLGAATKA